MLTQEQLAHTRFPLGTLHKTEARELAEHTAHYYDRRYIRREKYRI